MSDADPGRSGPSRETALAAENARLRAALARAGVDIERTLAETATAREETRQARDEVTDAAAGHARALEAGRAELADAEALNDGLRRANAALGESEDRCRAVLESATDYAIITTDRQGRITGWNAGARNVLGWSESEVLWQHTRLIFAPEDRDAGVPEAEMGAALGRSTTADERWHVRRDGTRFWTQGQLTPLRDGSGELRGFVKILRDRTEQRAAERERERLLAMLGQSQTMVCDWAGRIEVWTQGMERLFGFTAAEAMDAVAWELLRSECPVPWPEVEAALRREGRWVGEVRHRAKDRSLKVVQETWLVQPGLNGEPSSLVVAAEDQTDARRAEAALRESEGRLRLALDAGGLGDFEWDLRTDAVRPSARAREIFGFGPGEGERSADYFARIVPEDQARVRAAMNARLVTGWAAFGYRIRLPDGSVRHVFTQSDVVRGADGAPERLVGMFADETERLVAEAALRESEARFRALVTASSDVVYRMSPDWSELRRLDGRGIIADTPDPSRSWLERYIYPDDQPRMRAAIEAAIRAEGVFALEHRVRRVDGSLGWMLSRAVPLLGPDGEIVEWFGAASDVTERKRAEEGLRESQVEMERQRRLYEAILTNTPDLAYVFDLEHRFTYANEVLLRMWGRTWEEAIGRTCLELGYPDWHAAMHDREIEQVVATKQPIRGEVPFAGTFGRRIYDYIFVPVIGPNGEVEAIAGTTRDVTERKQAEAELRRLNETLERRVGERTADLRQAVSALHAEALEREQAEAALRQSQKMEAVGQLTGGIAHDFNNMLQAIAGSLELMGRRIGQGRAEEAARFVEDARRTVERAAALTHRLLAFARRQALQPRPVNPDELVEGMAELIRRTVGPGVAVDLRLSGGTWPVRCDPNQLENALLNLCINARDAMPEGGRLAIATRHVHLSAADVAGQEDAAPGDYVEIAVADTGTGMDEATRARVFEPFFTTKPIGQGTGLGLSQLYGFVRQSYGVVCLDSAPGQGTTVRLYLPRHGQAGASNDEESGAGASARPEIAGIGAGAGSGTVLLVEDEAGVRASVAEHLRELGYAVMEAADGPAALRMLQGSLGARVDLLVTDVGLPDGLNGRQVAEAARERRPDLPVLFITGFAGVALEEQLAPGMAVIGKPFTLDALAARVRAMIKGERAALP